MSTISKEEWKDIDEVNGLYQVSNLGRVKSVRRDLILSPAISTYGYPHVNIRNKGIKFNRKVHRLVAIYFVPNPENKPQVNHIDGNKLNNAASNLEWTTQIENVRHSLASRVKIGDSFGNYWSKKLNHTQAKEIRTLFNNKEYSKSQLSKKFNVSIGNIQLIIQNKIWVEV